MDYGVHAQNEHGHFVFHRLPKAYSFTVNNYVEEDKEYFDEEVYFFAYEENQPTEILNWIMENNYEKSCLSKTISRGSIASDYEVYEIKDVYDLDEETGELCHERWDLSTWRNKNTLTFWGEDNPEVHFSGNSFSIRLNVIGPHEVVVQGKSV